MERIPVKFNQHPFAFILILCDEIQDWGRGNHKSSDFESKNKDFIALEWVEVKIQENMPEIHFKIFCENTRLEGLIDTLQKRLVKNSGIQLFINGVSIL